MNDKEEEETVEASNMVEPVDLNAVEITDNIVFRKLLVSSNICSQMPIFENTIPIERLSLVSL